MSDVSKKGEKFLVDLNAYLMTRGINEKEVRSFVDEAETHLIEGEADGKTVEDIFGKTPQLYAEEVTREMTVSVKENIKYVMAILLGASAYLLLGDVLEGNVSFSWVTIIGFPITYLFALIMMLMAIRQSSFKSKWLGFGIIYVYAILILASFIGVIITDKLWGEPIIELAQTGTILTGVLSILIFILLAVFLKTWLFIFLPIIILGPQALLNILNVTNPLFHILGLVVSYMLMFL